MFSKVCPILTLVWAGAVYGQSSSAPAETSEGGKVYVRRFTLGATLTVPGLSLVPKGTANPVTTTPPVNTLYTTTDNSYRPGYGVMTQLVIKGRFAVNASLLLRRVGYKLNTDIIRGPDSQGNLTHASSNEDTRAKFVDLPVTVRYYVKDRRAPGPRFFVEGGMAFRRVWKVKTQIDQTDNEGTTTCCVTTPPEFRRTVRGFVGGIGVQVTEPMGIRIIPAFRYTRWLDRTFGTAPTPSMLNQIEGMVTLSF